MPLRQEQTQRFQKYTAKTLDALLEILNTSVNPYARILQLGILENGEWVAVSDLALQLVLTVDDLEDPENGLVDAELDENATSSEDELGKPKLDLAA